MLLKERAPCSHVRRHNCKMDTAGLLLTGGRSTRMGTDKANLRLLPHDSSANDVPLLTLAEKTAELLQRETDIAVEVGPGFTHLHHVSESPAHSGPLAALVAGAAELRRLGRDVPVLLVATDMPRLTQGMLGWLASYQPGRSVVPLAGGRAQPLCARYQPADIGVASELVARGERAMSALIDAVHPVLVPDEVWGKSAGDKSCLDDLDTPDQLASYVGRVQ